MSRSEQSWPTAACSPLLAAKLLPKIAFVSPLAWKAAPRHATLTTLLMSTALTFGTISSLYGLNAGIIDETQFSLLVTGSSFANDFASELIYPVLPLL